MSDYLITDIKMNKNAKYSSIKELVNSDLQGLMTSQQLQDKILLVEYACTVEAHKEREQFLTHLKKLNDYLAVAAKYLKGEQLNKQDLDILWLDKHPENAEQVLQFFVERLKSNTANYYNGLLARQHLSDDRVCFLTGHLQLGTTIELDRDYSQKLKDQ